MIEKSYNFSETIRSDLGEAEWRNLHAEIIKRFSPIKHAQTLRYIGVVNWVYCSPIGKIFAGLLAPFELLPKQNARDTQFEFVIKYQADTIKKQRRYFLGASEAFTFRSTFSLVPSLHEEFKAGLGMKIKLSIVNGDLLFSDHAYFWRIGSWRIPIPRWCSIGRFELLHHNIDARFFQVIIRISHPLFGVLFYQRGKFFRT